MGEENAFAVIRENLSKVAPTRGFLYRLRKMGIIGEPMGTIEEKRALIIETEKEVIVIFDSSGIEVASVELKDGVLEISPKVENVSKLTCSLKDFDKESNIIKTTKDVILESKGGENKTTFSQTALTKARCYPL